MVLRAIAHYHLKWMTPDGRIIWFDADARNGRVLRSSPGRDSFDDNDRFRGPGNAGPRPFVDRYPPYTADPYDGGYGRDRARERNFGPPPGYARPYRDWGGGRGNGRGEGRGGRPLASLGLEDEDVCAFFWLRTTKTCSGS
jgi:hypothetical protein